MTATPVPVVAAATRDRPLATWKALVLALAAFVVGALLVATQILVAQAKGIDTNLQRVAVNLEAANGTVDLILQKSSATPRMDAQVQAIGGELARIDARLRRTNRTLARTGGNVGRLSDLTDQETGAAGGMEQSLQAIQAQIAELSRLLGEITPVSRSTGAEIAAIRSGSAAAARGLASITAKLNRYGLPPACPAKGRC